MFVSVGGLRFAALVASIVAVGQTSASADAVVVDEPPPTECPTLVSSLTAELSDLCYIDRGDSLLVCPAACERTLHQVTSDNHTRQCFVQVGRKSALTEYGTALRLCRCSKYNQVYSGLRLHCWPDGGNRCSRRCQRTIAMALDNEEVTVCLSELAGSVAVDQIRKARHAC
jgi:hypothetical protein